MPMHTFGSPLHQADDPIGVGLALVLAFHHDARLRDGILAVGVGHDRGRPVERELVDVRRVLVVAVEHFVERDRAADVAPPCGPSRSPGWLRTPRFASLNGLSSRMASIRSSHSF